ncbi:hypothetical protein [Aquimarina hainanensis]|uniref:hypothetical protein n=1 Tax=Aquimarina hainanensis TaxID=1578017 RepID=UPI00361853CF
MIKKLSLHTNRNNGFYWKDTLPEDYYFPKPLCYDNIRINPRAKVWHIHDPDRELSD